MYTNFKMLPKTNYTPETKCLAVFFYVQSMALKIACSNRSLLWILLGIADFVILLKAQITRKKINLPKLFFVN